MKSFATIGLLILSNIFMTFAWYGHLKFKELGWISKWGLPAVILLSWGIALFEYNNMKIPNLIFNSSSTNQTA